MRLDLSKWGKSQSSPSSSIPQKIKDFHQKNHELSVFMDSAGFLCILCVFVESNPPKRTNATFFLPHFPVFVVFQKRFLYILFFTYRLSGDQCPPEIPQRLRGAHANLSVICSRCSQMPPPLNGEARGRCPHRPWVGAQNRVWEIRFTGRRPQRDPSNTRRRSSGRRYGRWRPPECPDRTTRWDRRCPSTSSCPRADRTQTADRGRAHG